MAEASSLLECPVCGEYFDTPKLLACNHVICRKCIVDWLRKSGRSGGCPLCRASILPSSSSSRSSEQDDDLEALVEALPTDLALVAKVESARMLLDSHHVCMSCENSSAASSFCLQCNMKLCKSCAKAHKKFPAMKNHVVEELDSLTAERLAEINRIPCKSHDDRLAELYCSTHQHLICLLCSSTTHRSCADVKSIKEAAAETREQLRLEAQRLREKETAMRQEIKKSKDKFADHHAKAQNVFDNLQQYLEKRRQEVIALIRAEEDKMALDEQEQVRAAITSQAGVLDNLLGSAPDDALLDMEKSMVSRLQALEEQTARAHGVQEPADVVYDPQTLTQLKSAISTLGHRGQASPASSNPPPTTASASTPASIPSTSSSSSTTSTAGPSSSPSTSTSSTAASSSRPSTPSVASSSYTPASAPRIASSNFVVKRPRGAKLAEILKVGDRVQPNSQQSWPEELRWKCGTVVSIPSRWCLIDGLESEGRVDVQWDSGQSDWYDMGRRGYYDLELV